MCGFTAGGSGMVSIDAAIITAPKTQIMHDFDFIPACVPVWMITDFQRCSATKWQETDLRRKKLLIEESGIELVLSPSGF